MRYSVVKIAQNVQSRLSQKDFFKNIFTLAGGIASGQLVLLIAAPLLTRLFTPEEFGLFAIIGALGSIFGIVVCLNYQYVVPISEKQDEAIEMVSLSLITCLVFSLLTVLLIFLSQDLISDISNETHLRYYLWALPFTLLGMGTSHSLTHWFVRNQAYRTNAFSNFILFSSQAVLQVGLGLAQFLGWGLVLGYTISHMLRGLFLVVMLERRLWRQIWAVPFSRLHLRAREHWRYPTYNSGGLLLQICSQMLPVIIIAAIYGPAAAGIFALAQKTVGLPVRFISESASYVFLGSIGRRTQDEKFKLFKEILIIFSVTGVVCAVPVVIFAPAIFDFVFGQDWRMSGEVVRYLTPLFVARFIIIPVSQILNVINRQDVHFLSSTINLGAVFIGFGIAYAQDFDFIGAVISYSIWGFLSFFVYFALMWRTASNALVN